MKNIIGADAAKLAGLQIDTLQKVRSGHITLGQWERFNNLSTDDREARFGDGKKPELAAPAKTTKKFALLADLGIITVPDNYDHATYLRTFIEQNRKEFYYYDYYAHYYYDNDITDRNFPNPTRVLKSGDKLRVCAFKQVFAQSTDSEERMAFLATQKAIHLGAQGASLVFDQKRDQMPKGKRYASFDEPDRLWEDADGKHWVPCIYFLSDGTFEFRLVRFENAWQDNDAFLCFRDIK